MTTEDVAALIAKNPSLKTAKTKLEAMKSGSYCIHSSWGFGQIKSYNSATQRLIIDFTGKPGHPMDPVFCVKTLEVLPANHLLVRKQTETEKINKLIAEDPAQLFVEGLEAYPNQAATGIEIESVLAQVVGPDKFKRWWSAAKKIVLKDPRVGLPLKKTECYYIRETPISNEDEILEFFNGTRSARRRIKLADELVAAADKKDTNPETIKTVLTGIADAVKDSNQLTPAERLYGAYVRDELAKLAPDVDANAFVPTQSSLIANQRDIPDIVEKIPVQFQAHLLDLIKETFPIEHRDIIFNLLKISQGKFTTECINFLVENGHTEELADSLKRWQIEQNLRAPVLLWIVKNRHSKKFAKILGDLVTPRLLSSVFYAIDYEALQAASARRIPLAEILSDDTELIPDLLAAADTETARDLANTLLLNQGFEDLTKKSLLARFIKLFPSIQSLLTGDSEGKEEQLLVSRESYERKREEYETIVSKKIPENSKAIATAREHGDLKENSEYKMAKQDQQVLMAQKALIEKELSRARITDFKDAPTDSIGVGNIVGLKIGSTGKTATYTLLGAWDSIPEKNIIAYKTPLGQGLLTKRVGDTVQVKIGSAEETYTVTSIARYADAR
ncbi:transcription elongation factor GreAB [Opitutaceae bacterium TAV4]|uniref:GreA/GreB family elongation factor n=1 Tax=Geminisphaera colitermitum TaxID=1148786 RepID=UPI000158D173|nr:GreA/GreB family elongation factor [Geminisphaera colitermitum]RRJ96457.1 transcription elongation factor GreAB [Opitutaceae bacterium TAV4]RRJ99795.1 transcription elongation factor GreAB [Opitutaceae bacterium TAV3]